MNDVSTLREGQRVCTRSIQRIGYRSVRRLKAFFLEHHANVFARLFFRCLERINASLSPRTIDRPKEAQVELWKATYFVRFPKPQFVLETEQSVAVSSDDHKWPRGTLHDNSVNRRFNLKVYDYFKRAPSLSLLDLGCAGGGLVKSFLADGYTAIGVEGSDASQRLRSAEWDTIPYHLFTADITEPFRIIRADSGASVKFDVVTCWEVLEHIPETGLVSLLRNIRHHLTPSGIFVGSVATFPDGNPVTGAVYHVTLRPRNWWLDRFREQGFVELERIPFETRDYVRGHGMGLRDWDPADGDGFHLVLKFDRGRLEGG